MRAMLCTALGGPTTLAHGDLPIRSRGAGKVLVDVRAAAVRIMDLLMAQGGVEMRLPLPHASGGDLSDVVREAGDGVVHVEPGDVPACGHWAEAWAERMVAAASQVTPPPEAPSLATACTVRYAYGTALCAPVERARLQFGIALARLQDRAVQGRPVPGVR